MWNRAAAIVGILLSVGGCVATPPTSVSASHGPQATSNAAKAVAGASAGRRLRVRISAAGFALDGEKIASDRAALKVALGRADVLAVDIQAEANAPAHLIFEALTLEAGPNLVRRSLSWQDLVLEFSDRRRREFELAQMPASIFSWRDSRASQLWKVDAGSAVENLGPYQPGEDKAEPAVISRLTEACARKGCELVVELHEERLAAELRAWQRLLTAVGMVADAGARVELRAQRPVPSSRNVDQLVHTRLPAPLIQAVVRFSYGHFRACYEAGLARNSNLQGRVTVKFVIERDGAVTQSRDEGSDIPDAAVRDCVVHEFVGLKFPEPETGIITVVYPIMLSPG
ncbi:MAG TPA: AgmX/PglI C-terminal domain-containing protein [Polyangiaceae bacterium]|nr:AgmX/PglI C-terminal domain-containing protein [Polyangiaceae bacterium]